MPLRIVADENMPNVEAWFSAVSNSIVRKPGRSLTPSDLAETDVLLVRSITQVNEALLTGTPVKFVGSATIGTDHVDQGYLQTHNIPFSYAPGCNAQSVADWMLAVFARLYVNFAVEWWNKTIAIVGVGNVGSTVIASLSRFGCRLLLCDPLKHDAGLLPEHQSLESVLSQADIVCLHTPHSTSGHYPTHHMIGQEQLELLKPNAWLINAGRGPVCQRDPLVKQIEAGVLNVVLDVWPNEPVVDEQLLNAVALASPHVAGYSLEGKFKGTEMLALAVAEQFGLGELVPPALPLGLAIDAELFRDDNLQEWASAIALAAYDPARDTVTMLNSLQHRQVSGEMFDRLRKEYPTRREFSAVSVINAPLPLQALLTKFGFKC